MADIYTPPSYQHTIPNQRPLCVLLVAALELALAISGLGEGVLSFLAAATISIYHPEAFLAIIFVVAIISLTMGLLHLLLAYHIYSLTPWAWIGANVLNTIGLVVNIASGDTAWASAAISLIIILCLQQGEVKSAFARGWRETT